MEWKVDKPYHFLDQLFILFTTLEISKIYDALKITHFFIIRALTQIGVKNAYKKIAQEWQHATVYIHELEGL